MNNTISLPRQTTGTVPPDDPVLAAYRAGHNAGRAYACVAIAEMEDRHQQQEHWHTWEAMMRSWRFREDASSTPAKERTSAQQCAVLNIRLAPWTSAA